MKQIFKVSIVLYSLSFAFAQNSIEQTIELRSGWNAVWLEVQPYEVSTVDDSVARFASVETVFSDPAIMNVAALNQQFGTADDIFDASNPNSAFSPEGWSLYKKGSLVDRGDLLRVQGNRAYLIEVSAPMTLSVTGEVRYFAYDWNPNAYNLVGFGINKEGSIPTFTSFFQHAGVSHPVDKIYTLNTSGVWVKVNGGDSLEHGKAYWVYSNGASDYAGPVSAQFSGESLGKLSFGSGQGALAVAHPTKGSTEGVSLSRLTVTNESSSESGNDLRPFIEKVTPDGTPVSSDELQVYKVSSAQSAVDPNAIDYTVGAELGDNTAVSDAALTPGSGATFYIGAHRNWTDDGEERVNVYKVHSNDSGGDSYRYLPMYAREPSVVNAAGEVSDMSYGLWVGDVVINEVSSITEEGSPVKPTEVNAPIRIILHVGASGSVNLLSKVMWMQEAVADPNAAPAQVLILDESLISAYQGIEERNGKLVGRRVETVSYDMPLNADNPLNSGGDGYALLWGMNGSFSRSGELTTMSPLVLGATHRSNPFRHVFHPSHGEGRVISRVMNIAFDSDQPKPFEMTGTYTEEIDGLTTETMVSKGTLTLYKVNNVTTLITQ